VSTTQTTSALEAAREYTQRGERVVPVPLRQKEPAITGWQNLRLTEQDLPQHFKGACNVGVLTGEPSGRLIDADCDAPEAVAAAAVFLPRTDRVHGRTGKRASHYWYRVLSGLKTTKFQFTEAGADKPTMLIEVRSTGCQTVVPPSVHPSGEAYVWERDGQPAEVDASTLLAAAGEVAACALLVRAWPGGPGSRDDIALALCGMLLRGGWSEDATDHFVMTVARIAGDEEWRDRDKAAQTARKIAEGKETTGAPKLSELLPNGKAVVAKAREWLNLRGGAEEIVWDEPVPLPGGMPGVDAFDIELLPAALRGWVWDVAERMQVPTDFPAVAAMVSLAAVVGRQVGIHPKREDDWLVVANLWGALVGRPSAMKTPALEAGLKPLDRLITEAVDEHKCAVAEYEAKAMVYKARLAAHEADLKRAAKDGDEEGLARTAATPPEKPVPPVKRRYKTNDATIEKIGELLIENPNGLLQFRDELVGWLRNLDKPGHEDDRTFFLESFNGTTRNHEVDRIGRGSLCVPALCLSLLGGIQPGPLASYVYDAGSESSAGNDGLLQRFQLLVWPDEPKTWRNVDRWPNTEAKNVAYAVYKRLANLDPLAFGATVPEGDPGAIPALRFTAGAQEIFDPWRERLERRLRSGEMSAPLESHLTKYRSLMPSLALLFHLADAPDGDTAGVSEEAAVRAVTWCAYLESHAKRLYAHAENPGMERARALLDHIQGGDVKDGMPVRQLYRHQWSRLRTPEEVGDAIKTLEAFGWVRMQQSSGGLGRPSDVLRVHPSLVLAQEKRAA